MMRATPVCSAFPGRYMPRPSFPVTLTVCIVTHSPPNVRIPQHMTNRRPSVGIAPNAQQPLASSIEPVTKILTSLGKIHRIHRSRKHIRTLLSITQPQICAMDISAFFAACGIVIGLVRVMEMDSFDLFGRIIAVIMALRI